MNYVANKATAICGTAPLWQIIDKCSENNSHNVFCRLHSGWSVETANLDKWRQPDPMSTDEHEKILEVIEKAEAMERAEMQRVGYVCVERTLYYIQGHSFASPNPPTTFRDIFPLIG